MNARTPTLRAALLGALAAMAAALPGAAAAAEQDEIIVQSTTSTANSGFFDQVLPQFEARTGIKVKVVAVGTGQALRNAANCDGDVVLVHAPRAEADFVAKGLGVRRHPLMSNDFVIVGPAADPAGIAGMRDAAAAMARIAAAGAPFASRGDDSGTHKAERRLWRAAGLDPDPATDRWLRELGAGMGATLNAAAGMGAYALTDRATWLAFANKADLRIMVEGDPRLLNHYGVILVNPARCPNVNAKAGQAFIDWLLSAEGRAAIAGARVHGAQLFRPAEPQEKTR
ncbi:tungstate transport system substrate-binding protein [Oceanicella actignis]|nr:tungstate transport system substrate-binding protein [Oceanicella actignis]